MSSTRLTPDQEQTLDRGGVDLAHGRTRTLSWTDMGGTVEPSDPMAIKILARTFDVTDTFIESWAVVATNDVLAKMHGANQYVVHPSIEVQGLRRPGLQAVRCPAGPLLAFTRRDDMPVWIAAL